MSNVIFVISVLSLPDPLSSTFVGFKYFMHEEFFLFFSVARAKNLSLPVLAGIILDLHGIAESSRTSYFFRAFSTNLTSSSQLPSMFELRYFSVQSSFFAVTFPMCLTKHLAENTQCLGHLSPDKKYPLGEVVFNMVNWVNAVYCPGGSRSASTSQ